jgi:peptidyl-tRNA hydrolase
MAKRKMYILIKDTLPSGIAITAAAHASLAMYLKYQNNEAMQEYIETSFAKVICKVDDLEFERAKEHDIRHLVLSESTLPGIETAIVFFPEEELPKQFKYYSLWK